MTLAQTNARPVLELIAQASARAADLVPEELPDVLGEIEKVKCQLRLRLADRSSQQPEDNLLTAEEAAKILSISEDSLYRKAWPFKIQPVPGRIRFSKNGIQDYIRRKQGR